MGRVVSPTPTPLSSGRVVPALVASYDMHGRAVGLFYTQPAGQTEIEAEDQTFYLTQSQYTNTGPTSPSADPRTPEAWEGSHRSANIGNTSRTKRWRHVE